MLYNKMKTAVNWINTFIFHILFRMRHKLHFEDRKRKVIDANVMDADRYEIYDPRNPLTKRRREASKNAVKDINAKQKL